MSESPVRINRAPVLTLWGVVVAERLGYEPDTALTMGRVLAGLNAQKKGRAIGLYHAGEGDSGHGGGEPKRSGLGEDCWLRLCDRPLPALHTPDGLRAVTGDQPVDPEAVRAYLTKSFGDALEPVRAALVELADSYSAEELESRAFGLYEAFRPEVARGQAGWGQKGELSLERIRSLVQRASE